MSTSSTNTRPAVANSSVELMPLNTLIASAEKPAGPVTAVWRPSGASANRPRRSSTASVRMSDSPSGTSTGAITIAALPSWERIGCDGEPVCSGGSFATSARNAWIAAVSCAVRPALAREDDDGLGDVGRAELVEHVQHAGGLGVAGQEARRLVLLRVLELAGRLADGQHDQDPDREDDPLAHPGGGQRRDPSQHPGHATRRMRPARPPPRALPHPPPGGAPGARGTRSTPPPPSAPRTGTRPPR